MNVGARESGNSGAQSLRERQKLSIGLCGYETCVDAA